MRTATEGQVCDVLTDIMDYGAQQRRLGQPVPLLPGTLAHTMASAGWRQEDLRLTVHRLGGVA